MPFIGGATFGTLFSTALLTIPAVLALRRVVRRRDSGPIERGPVERQMVLLASLVGALGAVAWSDGLAFAVGSPYDRGELASILLGYVAPIPLASIPWFAGEALSGASERPWLSLIASAAVSSVLSWTTYAICWQDTRAFEPITGVIQLAASVVSGFTSANTYLMTRGEPRAALPAAARELLELDQ